MIKIYYFNAVLFMQKFKDLNRTVFHHTQSQSLKNLVACSLLSMVVTIQVISITVLSFELYTQ